MTEKPVIKTQRNKLRNVMHLHRVENRQNEAFLHIIKMIYNVDQLLGNINLEKEEEEDEKKKQNKDVLEQEEPLIQTADEIMEMACTSQASNKCLTGSDKGKSTETPTPRTKQLLVH